MGKKIFFAVTIMLCCANFCGCNSKDSIKQLQRDDIQEYSVDDEVKNALDLLLMLRVENYQNMNVKEYNDYVISQITVLGESEITTAIEVITVALEGRTEFTDDEKFVIITLKNTFCEINAAHYSEENVLYIEKNGKSIQIEYTIADNEKLSVQERDIIIEKAKESAENQNGNIIIYQDDNIIVKIKDISTSPTVNSYSEEYPVLCFLKDILDTDDTLNSYREQLFRNILSEKEKDFYDEIERVSDDKQLEKSMFDDEFSKYVYFNILNIVPENYDERSVTNKVEKNNNCIEYSYKYSVLEKDIITVKKIENTIFKIHEEVEQMLQNKYSEAELKKKCGQMLEKYSDDTIEYRLIYIYVN